MFMLNGFIHNKGSYEKIYYNIVRSSILRVCTKKKQINQSSEKEKQKQIIKFDSNKETGQAKQNHFTTTYDTKLISIAVPTTCTYIENQLISQNG